MTASGGVARIAVGPRPGRMQRWSRELRWVSRRQPLATLGALILVFFILVSLFPDVFATKDPLLQEVEVTLQGPSAAHPFGTDELGRDIYSRVVFGTGLTIFSGFIVVFIATVVGTALGLLAGYRGGFLDGLVMRLSDMFLAFPGLVVAIAVVSFVGPSLLNAMLATALIWWPQYSRLVRGQVLSVKEFPYVEATRSVGSGELRILTRHILPNVAAPIVVKATLDFGAAMLVTASLSFLGVGAQPPSPELGAMVSSGRVYLLTAWWYTTFPSLVIFLAVLSLNLVGDGVRDVLDPTLRGV
jgi:peptide/nickel transport system permease protein